MLNAEQIQELEKEAELHNGKCGKCHQTIKIYRYKINKVHCEFLKAMANAVRDSEVNDVDISTIGIAYSVRSQCTKMRQHGLIARVKNDKGAQIARHWLITHKGWEFLNGRAIPEKVVVYNNQVLGHDGANITLLQVLGTKFDLEAPLYTETPVSEPEARVYDDVRQPKKHVLVQATYKGRDYHGKFRKSQSYGLTIEQLQVGHPLKILAVDEVPVERSYRDIAAFQKDWKIL